MRTIASLFTAAALLGGLWSAGALAEPPAWPMFGHDAAHSGRSTVVAAQTPTLRWASQPQVFSAHDYGPDLEDFSPVVGADGAVYLADGQGVRALNADGSLRWVVPLAGATESVALGVDGTVYAGHETGLLALNPDGSLQWSLAVGVPLRHPVVAANGEVYAIRSPVPGPLSLGVGALYVVAADGHEIRHVDIRGGPTATPAIDADGSALLPGQACTRWGRIDLVPTCLEFRALLYSVGSGASRATTIFASPKASINRLASPSVGADGTIYVAANTTDQRLLYSLSGSGRVHWATALPACCDVSPPAIGPDGRVFVETLGGNRPKFMHAVRPDGSLAWQTEIPGLGGGLRRPAVGADGTVYGAEASGAIFALAADGSVRWSLTLNPASLFSAVAIAGDGSVAVLGSLFDSTAYRHIQTVYAIGPGPR